MHLTQRSSCWRAIPWVGRGLKPESGRPRRLVRDSDNIDRAAAAKLERAATTRDFSRLRAHEGANGNRWESRRSSRNTRASAPGVAVAISSTRSPSVWLAGRGLASSLIRAFSVSRHPRVERIVQEHRRQRCASDERKATRFRASVQSTGGVRVPAAHGVRDVPLPKTPEGAIMAHNPPGILGMSVLND
jgi:hypothetical protein